MIASEESRKPIILRAHALDTKYPLSLTHTL